MPELAAHLERVARDVTDKLANAAAFYTMEYMAAKERGEHMPYGLDSVLKPIVAAALAACAREEARERAIVWELRPETSLSASDEIRLERRDGFKGRRWAITQRGYVLNKSGEWEYEPIPSSRTEEWLATTRWDTWEGAEVALVAALERAVGEKGHE